MSAGDIDTPSVPYKMQAMMEKWDSEEDYRAGLPPIVEERSTWHEADGTEVTDPDRIAELEAIIAQKE